MSAIHVLFVEDCDDDVVLIVAQLRRGGMVLTHDSVQTAAAIEARPPDVVISDYNMPAFSAEDALKLLHSSGCDAPFILVSGATGEETAAKLMRAGANDFVLKDRLGRLLPAVERELRDAGERRQRRVAEAALRASEQRFRLLAEHAVDVIFRYRLVPDPGIEYISPAVTAVTGYRPDELYADPALVFAMVEPEDRDRFRASWRISHPPALVVRWRRRDARLVWVEQRAVGICDVQGRLIAIEGILRDVTDQVLADAERDRLDRELRQAERLDSLGQLAGGIAHDFNNLLAVIIAYAGDVAASLPVDHESQVDVERISHAAGRAAALTRQLLIFSRLEPSQPQTLDPAAVVADVAHLLRRTIGEDIEFLTQVSDGLHPVTIDRTKFEQVLVNLVMNARAAMPDGGRLRIELTNADVDAPAPSSSPSSALTGRPAQTRLVRLTVTDTGCGMTAEVAQRAFEPFFTTKGPGHGTGLGLATAYGAIKEAGGEIRLVSQPELGTTIIVTLPAADVPVTVSAAAEPAATAATGGHILVVEDDDAVREIVVRILTRAGYRVTAAATPKEAIEACAIRAIEVDAMVSDVIMPEMSGPQLVERVRQTRPGLPVLLISGYTAGSLPGTWRGGEELPLLRKPFDAATLLRRVGDLLS